jgi:stage II sporulation protein AA (anti-sigma F factor antagonist)
MLGELDHHSAEEVRNKVDDRLERENFSKLSWIFQELHLWTVQA